MALRDDKEAMRKYKREWIARRRAEFFKDKKCIDCGATENLQIDHRDPKQKISHNVWSWSEVRRTAELSKCEVRCKTCHTEKHRIERIRHGTRSRYIAGCRCLKCKAAIAKAKRRWYKNKKIRDEKILVDTLLPVAPNPLGAP